METMTIHDLQHKGATVASPASVSVSVEALEGVQPGHIFGQQGDIYIATVAAIPADAHRDMHATGQLAPGTTPGSRHCVDPTKVHLWLLPQPSALQGPLIEAPDGCTITHPEHGWITLPPGLYAITYQRAYAAELQRIAD